MTDNVHTVLHQVIQIAVDDDYIRKNISDNLLKELKQSHNVDETNKRALTVPEQNLLPNFSCHSLRHSFVTRLVEADVAIPVIQQPAGHSRSDVTLDVYTTVTNEFKMREFDDFQAKMKHQDEEWHRNLLEQKKAENTGEQRDDREEG